MNKKVLYKRLSNICMVIFLLAGGYVGYILYVDYRSEQDLKKVQEMVTKQPDVEAEVVLPTEPDESEENKTPTPQVTQSVATAPSKPIEIDYESLTKLNSDAMGWISINDTKINYPVVQGKDNSYYLKRNVLKKYDRHGAVFMDAANITTSTNHTLYAHNMKNGTMFADLSIYRNVNSKLIDVVLWGETYSYQVVSAYYYDTKKDTFNYMLSDYTGYDAVL